MNKINALILTGYGLNCDYETVHAFDLVNIKAARVHINSLIKGTVHLEDFHILVFGGGFSWGDDHGAGVIQSIRLKYNIGDQLLKFINDGKLILGICNGFQTLVNLGFLPGFYDDYKTRSVALTFNDCGNFKNEWVKVKVNTASQCVFTKGITHLEIPIRHGEGKFYSDDITIDKLFNKNQVVLQYVENPNGSLKDIAGICDSTGRIFGLMPHPEGFTNYTNHPDWTRNKHSENELTPAMKIFQNAADFF